eukprot:751508-Hanusia_phi.AAC.3
MVFPGGYTEEEVRTREGRETGTGGDEREQKEQESRRKGRKRPEMADLDGDGELSLEEYTEMMRLAYRTCNKCMCMRWQNSGSCPDCQQRLTASTSG